MSMQLFPVHWANEDMDAVVVQTPIGRECFYCKKQIRGSELGAVLPGWEDAGNDNDDGVIHRNCLLALIGDKAES